jgi:hypothetical protein
LEEMKVPAKARERVRTVTEPNFIAASDRGLMRPAI